MSEPSMEEMIAQLKDEAAIAQTNAPEGIVSFYSKRAAMFRACAEKLRELEAENGILRDDNVNLHIMREQAREAGQDKRIAELEAEKAKNERRMNDLYTVNTVAGWAREQLRILAETLAGHNEVTPFDMIELGRIQGGIETVATLEAAREKEGGK